MYFVLGKKSKYAKFGNAEDIFPHEKSANYFQKSLSPKPKDKHNKLRETIEKLKAKSEIKVKDEFEFELDLPKENKDKYKKQEKEFEEKHTTTGKDKSNVNKFNKPEVYVELDSNNTRDSNASDRGLKKNNTKCNTTIPKPSNFDALSIATEQTLKDINKWLDDTPKFVEFSSASNSPSYVGCDDLETISGKPEPTVKKNEKTNVGKKEPGTKDHKKRNTRDTSKFFKKREVQRTIDRLQPGKSKGNLISNVQNSTKADELFPLGPLSKIKDTKNSLIVKTDTNAPKLSLGSVLDSFGKHNFVDDQKKEEQKILAEIPKENSSIKCNDLSKHEKNLDTSTKDVKEEKKEIDVNVEESGLAGGATPNLSAWFKAFGAPKVQPIQKKNDFKPDGKENEKLEESNNKISKVPAPIISPNTDSLMSPHGQPAPRQRKVSTGSSMSERSSFSQDMDSPRVGMDERGAYPAPYPSPLHRSPSGASPIMSSPRLDISPKATAYPTINGQIRCGFYQDTVSNKSSPDKSCSPKENPQSPYPHYSEHVYTPNTENSYYSYANSPYYTHAPNYSSTNPTPPYNMEGSGTYYDTSKSLTDQYQAKNSHNYTANSPASNKSSPAHPQHSPNLVLSPHSPNIHSPHSPNIHSQHSPNISQHSPINHPQHSPNFHSQQSPHPQTSPHPQPSAHAQHSPGFHIQNSPVLHSAHSPSVMSFDSQNSPVQTQMTAPVQSTPLRIQNQSNFTSESSPKNKTNPLDQDIYNQEQNEVVERSLQQSGQGAIFPVKKRAYNEGDVHQSMHSQRFDNLLNIQQRESHEPQNVPSNTLEKNFDSFSNSTDSPNKSLNMENDNSQNAINLDSSNNSHSLQTSVDTANNQSTKFQNAYPISYGRETACPLNIPNARNMSAVLQPDTVELSKYTNMGYTGPEVNYNKSTLPFSRPESNSINSIPVASQKSIAQLSSTVNQPLTQSMEISRFCTSNTSVSQKYKAVEVNSSNSAHQQTQNNFNSSSRTTDIQNPNVPCGFKSEVTGSRTTFTSPALDVEQPLALGRNLSSFSHLVDRYNNDERLLAGLQSSSTFYTDKGLGTPQLFNKSMSSNTNTLPMFSQADMAAMQQCYNPGIQGSPSLYNRPIPELQNSNTLQSDSKNNLQSQMQEKKKKRKSSKVGEY